MNHKDNHGQVGEALKVKMTLEKFNKYTKKVNFIENLKEISVKDLDKSFDISSTLPIIIDNQTQGDYEVICEHGVEVRYWND